MHRDTNTVVIHHVVVCDADVAHEARHWTGGTRGPVVDDTDQLEAADLTAFVTEAVKIGAHALSATGQAQEARALEQMMRDLGDKAAQSSTAAAKAAEQSAQNAAKTVSDAAAEAKKVILEAEANGRRTFIDTVTAAKEDMANELRRLFGGDSPELLDRIGPLLDRFSADLDAKVKTGTAELISTAAKQFDMSDESSPMAKHATELHRRQQQLAEHIDRQHVELTSKFDELTRELQIRAAKQSVATVTPLKGNTYADPLHALLTELATGLGDEYIDTSGVTGQVANSRKGDGVLRIAGGSANVVVEMSDSSRKDWNAYLDEAERNRDAQAALGLVRTRQQNAGHAIRVFGSRRIVLVFDPAADDLDLLRTVVLLLRTGALAAISRSDDEQIMTAEEKIHEALQQLNGIDKIKKSATQIHKQAQSIENECNAVSTGIERLLTAALTALGVVASEKSMAATGAA
ncbi:Fis family transcriptional regulator [Nocardia donostiensis]|uniref:Fis family transcriptional regulator n=1 Tax=Nocardia donostiensis TaxID=1538463 RepID=A0A1W0B355_9NOCA|nr:Fis family transcriptional regulator [Nocardia donostiensis]OQS16929.1 Fis family transcriptional regulator [Nocardia donostiensis]OQS21137.1 Fis family transcriptional regulator [Nocardia donostiensis]